MRKGVFSGKVFANGFDVTGFDPTYEGNNPRVEREYFKPGSINQANGLILRHVLEHVLILSTSRRQIAEANRGTGRIYIEVPCFDWICMRRAWFDVFYEHVNYFRLSDFRRIFDTVIDCGTLLVASISMSLRISLHLREPTFLIPMMQ